MKTAKTPTKAPLIIRSLNRRVRMLEATLRRAARDMYRNEVVDTEMEHSTIGANGDFQTKTDWIEDRIEGWKHPNNAISQHANLPPKP